MSRTPIVLALIALAIAMFVLVSSNGPSSEVQVENVSSADADLHEEEEHVEVAIQMGRIQRYYQKWWAAGRAENAELAKFYLHEMEEAMEVVSDGNVSNEGVYVSNFMRIYGEKAFEKLETMLKRGSFNAMLAQGHLLVANCNACHVASGNSFIRIKGAKELGVSRSGISPFDGTVMVH